MKDCTGHKEFAAVICSWFAANRRDLPWRRTYDPYHVWISEVMLQQTQMDRAVEYFKVWMERFPDAATLAGAPEQTVLKAWEGLGYYSRARNILKAAAVLVAEHGGRLPAEFDALRGLPGIGPYTAGAIMSIAYDRPYVVADANVERLFARLGDVGSPMKEKVARRDLETTLAAMLQTKGVSPREFNQGLMEFGALVCTPQNPGCGECPVRRFCRAFAAGTVALRPVKRKKEQRIDIVMSCAIVEDKGKLFIQQRMSDDIWGGLWEFPGGRLKDGESPLEAARRELYEETELRAVDFRPFATVIHHYTRYRVTLHSFICALDGKAGPKLHAAQQYRWVPLEGLSEYAFPSGHRQLIAKMMASPSRQSSS